MSSNQFETCPPDVVPKSRSIKWWLLKLLAPALMLVVGVLLIIAVGFAQRHGWITAGGLADPSGSGAATQIHICPMHPQIRQPGPGRCSICGMALVPATSGGADLDELSVTINPAQRRLANIATAEVLSQPVSDAIQTVGAIAIDESRMATIASYVDGRLERLFADYTGVDVAEKDHLAVVYSPELYKAQVDYLETKRSIASMPPTALAVVREAQLKLLENTRQKLVELGLQKDQLAELDQTNKAQSRLTIYAPIGGTVIEKLAVEGKYIKAGEPIYRIADLSTVWLLLELYPEDAARIRFGQRVDAELQSLPGEQLKGRVAFVGRTVDTDKRAVRVRVEYLNEDRRLRPGDYANATIHLPIGQSGEVYDEDLAGRWISPMHPQILSDEPGDCPICGMKLVPTSRYGYSDTPVKQPPSLFVPRSALLMAGRNSVVYVEEEPGRFEIRPVTLGPILRDKVIILDGVKVGEKVATAGNFLIDSQMQLAGKPSLIDPTRAIALQKVRKKPLQFTDIDVVAVEGENGKTLEALFAAYFRIQKSLAADSKPMEADAVEVHEAAGKLANAESMPPAVVELLQVVAQHSEHLHHLELQKARHEAFRPISHAVVKLASLVRGSEAANSFHHMFCPMVKGGSGDWLQQDKELRNPYWGSKMLTCGERAHAFPVFGLLPAEASVKQQGNPSPSVRNEKE